jgi:hypothetical protein
MRFIALRKIIGLLGLNPGEPTRLFQVAGAVICILSPNLSSQSIAGFYPDTQH